MWVLQMPSTSASVRVCYINIKYALVPFRKCKIQVVTLLITSKQCSSQHTVQFSEKEYTTWIMFGTWTRSSSPVLSRKESEAWSEEVYSEA